MDDSYYGKGKWSGNRYSLIDHIQDYIPIKQIAVVLFCLGVLYMLMH
jgi:hypothetical protein